MRPLLLSLTVGLLVAADQPAGDLAKLQGTWSLVSVEENGNVNKKAPDTRLVIKDDGCTFARGDKPFLVGKVKLNEKVDPKTIDLVPEIDALRMSFIYTVEGDTLRLCYSDKPDRPKEFKTKDHPGVRIAVYQRKGK